MSRRVLAACVAVGLAAGLAAAGEGVTWTENAAEALAAAAKEGKDLLVNFTGSDWCPWCQKLDAEVFSQPAFAAEARKSFVFLKLDFPEQRPLSDEVKKQNAEWEAKYRVTGYPTIVLADAAGKPYGRTGYTGSSVEKYLEHLAELRKIRVQRDEALAKAKAAKGVERAKLLDAALSHIDSAFVLGNYDDLVGEILKLDPANKAGLKNKYGAMAVLGKIEAAAQAKDFDGAIKLAGDALKTYGQTGSTAQDVLFLKALCFYSKGDKKQARSALEAALKAAPDGPKAEQIKMILDKLFKDTE